MTLGRDPGKKGSCVIFYQDPGRGSLTALKIMEEQNIPINFESVASFAQVSKTWIYAQPAIKEQIKSIKKVASNRNYMKNQAIKIKAQEKEIHILSKQNKQLREQLEELKQQLEVAYAALYNRDT